MTTNQFPVNQTFQSFWLMIGKDATRNSDLPVDKAFEKAISKFVKYSPEHIAEAKIIFHAAYEYWTSPMDDDRTLEDFINIERKSSITPQQIKNAIKEVL